ncbi:MAG: hypothetical protein ACRCYY_10150 [Trueperaceae bacterium]
MTIQVRDAVVTINKQDAFQVSLMAKAVMNNRPSFRVVHGKSGEQLYTECAKDLPNCPERLTLKSGAGEVVQLLPEDIAWLERLIADTQR